MRTWKIFLEILPQSFTSYEKSILRNDLTNEKLTGISLLDAKETILKKTNVYLLLLVLFKNQPCLKILPLRWIFNLKYKKKSNIHLNNLVFHQKMQIKKISRLLFIVSKCHFVSVVPWRDILKYLQKCEGCTHFCETLYIYIYIYIYGGALRVMVTIIGKGNSNASSNSG